MKYLIDVFSPETAAAFAKSKKNVTGFILFHKAYVKNQQIGPGDKFICYVTKLKRFVGVLEVKSEYYIDNSPLFSPIKDPFVLRFKVKPLVWLPLENAIPIHTDSLWNTLSFTKDLPKNSCQWSYKFYSSPRVWPEEDCMHIEKLLLTQATKLIDYPLSKE